MTHSIHVVGAGEYLHQIAYRYGVTPGEILELEDNRDFNRERGDHGGGHILAPGDVVVIPARAPRPPVTIVGGGATEFTAHVPRTTVKIQVRVGGAPVPAGKEFRVDAAGEPPFHGQTATEGEVEFQVGVLVRRCRLEIESEEPPAPPLIYDLELGGLDPSCELSGQRQRLQALGLYDGPIHGPMDAATQDAIARFRTRRARETGSECNDTNWISMLEAAYGC